jgi:hypothetical protein
LPPDSALVAVLTPANGTIRREGGKLLINRVVVDYAATSDHATKPDKP